MNVRQLDKKYFGRQGDSEDIREHPHARWRGHCRRTSQAPTCVAEIQGNV